MDIDLLAYKLLKRESPETIINDLKSYLLVNGNRINFNWHPLGFVYSKLSHIPDVGDLRLHVWLENDRRTQFPLMPIHDHIFNVNSFIITGKVNNLIYDFEIEDGQMYRIYKAQYNHKGSLLMPTEILSKYGLKSTTNYKTGDFYIVKKGVFHETTVNDGEFAATLVVVTEKDETKQPKILGPMNGDKYFYSREECTEPILKLLYESI